MNEKKDELQKNLNLSAVNDQELDDYMNDDFFDQEEEATDLFAPVKIQKIESTGSKALDNGLEYKEEVSLNGEKEDANSLDDSYVLSNFDVLFDSLYNDVNGANNLISELIERKKSIHSNEALISDLKEKLAKEKDDFDQYIKEQKNTIELEKRQAEEYIKNQKVRLQNEEAQFNEECEATRKELDLAAQGVTMDREQLEMEREQFNRYKELEEEKLNNERVKLASERELFMKDKKTSEESIKTANNDLKVQKEQFLKSKELEEKKLELESKNLAQSCARFKELVSQFNSGFSQLPKDSE